MDDGSVGTFGGKVETSTIHFSMGGRVTVVGSPADVSSRIWSAPVTNFEDLSGNPVEVWREQVTSITGSGTSAATEPRATPRMKARRGRPAFGDPFEQEDD